MFKLFIFVLYYILTFSSALLFQNRQSNGQVDDTPGGNLGFQFDNYRGKCPIIPAYLTACNNTLYEGRWFAAEVGFTRNQVDTLACFVWDTYFDKAGIVHNFVYSYENGSGYNIKFYFIVDRENRYKTLKTKLTPVPGKPGIYQLDAGLNNNDKIFSTFYYMDAEMFVFWEVTCREGDMNHYRNIVIGYRDFNTVVDKEKQLDRVLGRLSSEGGNARTTPVYHGIDCRYPAKTTNPYR